MSKHVKHVPKHRATPPRTLATEAPKKAVRTTLVLSSVAMATTGAAVAGGVFSSGSPRAEASLGALSYEPEADATAAAAAAERPALLSRSQDRRAATSSVDAAKVATLSSERGGALTRSEDASDDDPREVARALLSEFGFSADQFGCLDSLWTKESNWRVDADNPTSSAYGIPQALPGSKMASAGADWATNPATQIRWGLGYIQDRYGSPCGAWAHSQSHNWY